MCSTFRTQSLIFVSYPRILAPYQDDQQSQHCALFHLLIKIIRKSRYFSKIQVQCKLFAFKCLENKISGSRAGVPNRSQGRTVLEAGVQSRSQGRIFKIIINCSNFNFYHFSVWQSTGIHKMFNILYIGTCNAIKGVIIR